MRGVITIALLVLSNVFMTLAWYGHLQWKESSWLKHAGIWAIILFSWGLAFLNTSCKYLPTELDLKKMEARSPFSN